METILTLLIGLGAGFYLSKRQATTEPAVSRHPTDVIVQELETLKRVNASLQQTNLQLETANAAMREAERKRHEKSVQNQNTYKENDLSNVDNQIKFINRSTLSAVAPINREAARTVLYPLEKWIDANQPKWRLAFEVSLGAFIRASRDGKVDPNAFSSYNSKRVDFLLIDGFGNPKLAVEYNGSGHDLSADAADRMKVKRLALTRVGIPLLEIPPHAAEAEVLNMVNQTLAA